MVLFFYPLDFTFVCPTEIIAFSNHAEDFRKLGCEVLGVSVDSQFTHLAWYGSARGGAVRGAEWMQRCRKAQNYGDKLSSIFIF